MTLAIRIKQYRFDLLKRLGLQEDDLNPLRYGTRPFVFIHINKTAGTSICRALGIMTNQHFSVREVINKIGKDAWDSAYTFSVVRNPWDKVLSQYQYRIMVNKNSMAARHVSFEQWVQAVYGEHIDSYYHDEPNMFVTQLEWLRNHEGKVDVDFIARFENIEQDYRTIAAEVGASPHLPHLNRTTHDDYRTFYNDATRTIIGERFKDDIEYFGYHF